MLTVTGFLLCWVVPTLITSIILIRYKNIPLNKWDGEDAKLFLLLSIIYPLGVYLLILEYCHDFIDNISKYLHRKIRTLALMLITPINLTKKEEP